MDELTSQLPQKKVCDSGMTFYLLSTLWKRKQPLCEFVSEHPTWEVLADKSFWASPTVISRHGFPTECVSKAPDK